MGSGKSQSAIKYMNDNPDKKFIYITPYLDEAIRIKEGCPELKFITPSDKIPEYNFRKIKHTEELIKNGRNIASTHAAFRMYSNDMLKDISDQGYTLIIDESIELLSEVNISPDDIELLELGGWLKKEGDEYVRCERSYKGAFSKQISDILDDIKGFLVVNPELKSKDMTYAWRLPKELITSFEDVYVLTYLFDGQDISYMFKMYDLDYKKIGVTITEEGEYAFSEDGGYIPNYVKTLRSRIHILNNPKMNAVGDKKSALSMAWFKKSDNEEEKNQLKKNTYNFFFNLNRPSNSKDRMWSTYLEDKKEIQGKGYSKGYTQFNLRASNEYRNKKYLAYLVNLYMNVGRVIYYKDHGIEIDQDLYALSTMIQWIWRSAIRDGEEIYIYIPSRRMRELLIKWIDEVSNAA